ncbi:MAG: hypothetical protein HC913_04960 [Microscillaceae bacterium]|nr:hypothetical protein [Microscillaceae bacterium]
MQRNYAVMFQKWTFPWMVGLLVMLLGTAFQAPAQSLIFGNTTVNQSSVTNGTVAPFTNTLRTSVGTANGITLSKPGGQAWLTLPANPASVNATGTNLSFQIDPTGLAQGVYTATVQASAGGFTNGTFTVTLRVAGADAAGTTEVNIDFRPITITSLTPPTGWIFPLM